MRLLLVALLLVVGGGIGRNAKYFFLVGILGKVHLLETLGTDVADGYLKSFANIGFDDIAPSRFKVGAILSRVGTGPCSCQGFPISTTRNGVGLVIVVQIADGRRVGCGPRLCGAGINCIWLVLGNGLKLELHV